MVNIRPSSPSSPSSSATSTATTHVFIVGNGDGEVDPTRSTLGDEQLYQCFQRLPRTTTRIHFIRDADCTKSNCELQLERVVSRHSKPHDTLVFYYGGHGLKTKFKTPNRGGWLYSDVCDTVERCFKGDKVWFLIDCCYSGCFVNYIPKGTKKTYACIMSTHADHGAYDQWMMTYCFAQAMKGKLKLCSDTPAGATTTTTTTARTTRDVLEVMSEHHALLLNDWLQCSIIGSDIHADEPFPFRLPQHALVDPVTPNGILGILLLFLYSLFFGGTNSHHYPTTKLEHPDEKKVADESKWKRLIGVAKGDAVYAKSRKVAANASSLSSSLTLYTKAIVVQSDTVRATNVSNGKRFEVRLLLKEETPPIVINNVERSLLPGSYFDFCMPHVVRVHKLLAKTGRFLDHWDDATQGSEIWAIWQNKVYAGTVLANPPWHEISCLDDLEEVITESDMTGPFLWVEWKDEDGQWSIVPKCHCLAINEVTLKPTANELRQQQSEGILAENQLDLTPRKAMMRSMECMGKHFIVQEKQIPVTAYWDGKWYKGTTMGNNLVPPVRILAHHLHFENIQGNYYCVKWTEEDTYDLLPECLIDFSIK